METKISFQANFSCFIGNRAIVTGETLETFQDGEGLWWLCFENDFDPIARLVPEDINKLAGQDITHTSEVPS